MHALSGRGKTIATHYDEEWRQQESKRKGKKRKAEDAAHEEAEDAAGITGGSGAEAGEASEGGPSAPGPSAPPAPSAAGLGDSGSMLAQVEQLMQEQERAARERDALYSALQLQALLRGGPPWLTKEFIRSGVKIGCRRAMTRDP